MLWTYRVCRDQAGRYSIREVYYEQDGRLIGYGDGPAMPLEASPAELLQMVEWFRGAFDLPVLSLEEADIERLSYQVGNATDEGEAVSLAHVLRELAADPESPPSYT